MIPESSLEIAAQAGWQDAVSAPAGGPNRNPYPPPTLEYTAYEDGYQHGLEALEGW